MRPLLIALLSLYAALLPFERVLRAFSDAATDSIFKPYRVVAIAIGTLWIGWKVTTKKQLRFDRGDKSFFAIFLYGLVMALVWNAVEGNNFKFTTDSLPLVLFAFFMYVIVKDLKPADRDVARILTWYSIGLFAAAAISLLRDESLSGRLRGFYKNPNQMGVAATTCFLFWFSQFLFLRRPRLVVQVGRVAMASLSLALLMLSGSRGSAAAAAAATLALLVFSLLRRKSTSSRVRVLAFVGLLGAVSYPALDRFDEAYQQTDAPLRFQRSYAAESAEDRAELWRSGIHVGVEHFGLGVGMMQYLSHHQQSIREISSAASNDIPLGTHSDYVDLFASYGLFGLFVFIRHALLTGRDLVRRGRDPDATPFAILGIALFAQIMVVSISQNSFTGAEYFLVFALVELSCRIEDDARDPVAGVARSNSKFARPRPLAGSPSTAPRHELAPRTLRP